jgi:hypothetical protein
VLVGVIAAVAVERVGALARPAALAGHGSDGVDQRLKLGDVVAVSAGRPDGQRHARRVDGRVVFAARAAAIDGEGTGQVPPLSARMCVPSMIPDDQSMRPAALGRDRRAVSDQGNRGMRN